MTTPAESEARAPYRVPVHKCKCHEIPREPLFEWVDDDDDRPVAAGDDGQPIPNRGKVFTIPTHFEGHVALDYLELLHTLGSDAAFRWAVIKSVGVEGWMALRSLGNADPMFQTIAKVILDRIRGLDIEAPKAG